MIYYQSLFQKYLDSRSIWILEVFGFQKYLEKEIMQNKMQKEGIDVEISNIKEGFDGIRKSNSRVLFGILLGIIILDFIYECLDE